MHTYSAFGQQPTCTYPIILLHGWTGSNESWDDFYQDADVEKYIWKL